MGDRRLSPVQYTARELKHPELLIVERVKPGEYFIYHHAKSVHIRRLRRSDFRSPKLLGVQQLRGHEEGCATSSGRGHLCQNVRGKG